MTTDMLHKRRPRRDGNAYTERNWAPVKEPSKGSEKNHSLIAMRTVIATVAIIVLALGWTSEAVHVEVRWTRPVSLQDKSKNQNPPVSFICSNSPSVLRLCLAGKWPDFFSGGCQKASGDVSQRQRPGSTKPPTSGQPCVAVQRPHAPAGVCAPLQAEERRCVVRQTGWVTPPADQTPGDNIEKVHVSWIALSSVVLILAAVPLDLCEICAFAACAGC